MEYHELALRSISIVETEGERRVTYEDGGGVYTSKDGESSNTNNVVVEQRGTGLIKLDSLLKAEIPVVKG